jgi:uncharacterized protein
MSDTHQNAVAWLEIPVTDMKNAVGFYEAVFGYTLTIDESGPNPMAIFPNKDAMGVCGHLYPGTPATDGQGPTPHLAISGKLEDAMTRCSDAGGMVCSPVITIPPGRFAYIRDLDGNSVGMFETAA